MRRGASAPARLPRQRCPQPAGQAHGCRSAALLPEHTAWRGAFNRSEAVWFDLIGYMVCWATRAAQGPFIAVKCVSQTRCKAGTPGDRRRGGCRGGWRTVGKRQGPAGGLGGAEQGREGQRDGQRLRHDAPVPHAAHPCAPHPAADFRALYLNPVSWFTFHQCDDWHPQCYPQPILSYSLLRSSPCWPQRPAVVEPRLDHEKGSSGSTGTAHACARLPAGGPCPAAARPRRP